MAAGAAHGVAEAGVTSAPVRVLCLSTYPVSAAATRFRLVQFFEPLRAMGIECTLSAFLSESAFADLYMRRRRVQKALTLGARAVSRVLEAIPARSYDVVLVQRNAMLFGPPILEGLIARFARRPLVYDFDDAIWLHDESPTWGWLARVARSRDATAQLIRIARHVIACNGYTRDYALRFRDTADVSVIPTVVDTDVYRPAERPAAPILTVGWIGTHSTAKYLEDIRGPLEAVARKVPFRLKVIGAGRHMPFDGIDTEERTWSLASEVADYQSLDVGLYPVREDEWGQGKTGFKPVVYMSTGSVCLAAPVGGVTEFIRDGVNGAFARTPSEWADRLELLLTDAVLRRRLADAGRRTVVEGYSLAAQAPRLAEILRGVAGT